MLAGQEEDLSLDPQNLQTWGKKKKTNLIPVNRELGVGRQEDGQIVWLNRSVPDLVRDSASKKKMEQN